MSWVWFVVATLALWFLLMFAVVPVLARTRRAILRAAQRVAES